MKYAKKALKNVMPTKLTLFLDSSVLISALNSPIGASAKILNLAKEQKITLIISPYIIDETKRVIQKKLPKLKAPLIELEKENLLKISKDPNIPKVKSALKIIKDPKDAPILAAAIKSKATFLITLDKKDFIDDKNVAKKSKLKILTPGDFINFSKYYQLQKQHLI